MNDWLLPIVVAALVVMYSLRAWRRKAMRDAPVGYKEPDADAMMETLAAKALARAQMEHGVELSFEPESVEQVEAILAKIHEQHKLRPLTNADIQNHAFLWGAYVGEMIKKVKPGRWERDSAVAGENSYPLVYGDRAESYPCGWVRKRVLNGPEENVWHKFMVLHIPEKVEGERFVFRPDDDVDGPLMKEIVYRGGVVCFRIPAGWAEEYEEAGGGTFYEKSEGSGTLRLNVITMEAQQATPEKLAGSMRKMAQAEEAEVRTLPNGNILLSYATPAEEEGKALLIYSWLLGDPLPPTHARLAIFSFTILASQQEDARIQSHVALLEREIEAAQFATVLGR